MIISFLLLILGAIIQFFVYVLAQINWQFPPEILSAMGTVLDLVHILGQFLPFIADLIAIALILVPAHVIRYIFSLLLWLWSLVPWIGTRTEYPSMKPLDLQKRNMSSNTLDLRNGRVNTKRTMRDVKWPD